MAYLTHIQAMFSNCADVTACEVKSLQESARWVNLRTHLRLSINNPVSSSTSIVFTSATIFTKTRFCDKSGVRENRWCFTTHPFPYIAYLPTAGNKLDGLLNCVVNLFKQTAAGVSSILITATSQQPYCLVGNGSYCAGRHANNAKPQTKTG